MSVSFNGIGSENYLQWRMWIGLWVMLILWMVVAFERCHLITYFTRFTEEVFSVLISFLFCYDAITFIFKVSKSSLFLKPSGILIKYIIKVNQKSEENFHFPS